MIQVRLFARYREILQTGTIQFAGVEIQSIADLKVAICRLYPESVQIFSDPNCIVAINHEVISGNANVKSGDEVAFYPPVTGG